MNVGLLYTPVSIYQMTRGALVLFVGVFSVIFLRRRLWLYQFSPNTSFHFFSIKSKLKCHFRWVSLLIVMSGVALVGYSGSLIKDTLKDTLVPHSLRSLAARAAPVTAKGGEAEDLGKVLVGAIYLPQTALSNILILSLILGIFFILFAQIL